MLENIQNKTPLVIIAGPTAVGKTDLSIELAKLIDGRIISADSMQVYKGFDIGSAKAAQDEMQGIPHYLLDELEPDEEFNVFEFKNRAKKYITGIISDRKIPIIAGGTGFYIQSVIYDIDFSETQDSDDYRKYLEDIAASENGPEKLHKMLSEIDPESAVSIHTNNIKRTIRAIEYFHDTGKKISDHNKSQRMREPAYNFAYFVLNRDRKELYDRINRRVDIMISQGLEDEVRGLLSQGLSRDALSMQGLGYKEMASYIAGEISFEEAVYNIRINTRHFAKRQLTWFRRERDVIWVNYEDFDSQEEMLEYMINILKERSII